MKKSNKPAVPQSYGHKKEEVVRTLRNRILSNSYPAGSRLPTVDELVSEFDYSRTTMQQAIRQLQEEGFVETVNRKGLFVSANPPHRHRIGIVFPCSKNSPNWTKFFATFLEELPNVDFGSTTYEFDCYHLEGCDKLDHEFARLKQNIASKTLAGLILHKGAIARVRSIPDYNSLPVILINESPKAAGTLPVIKTDSNVFLNKAMSWFSERKRTKVASITAVSIPQLKPSIAKKYGLKTKNHWFCATGINGYGMIPNLIHLLLDYPNDERPDALLIANDQLADIAVNAVTEHGLHIGSDIDIVAHCNWPKTSQYLLPVRRLGFHAHDFIRASVKLIEEQRLKHQIEAETLIPALYDNEVDRDSRNGDNRNDGDRYSHELDETDAFVL
ncbi:GntR family transcriptional regulator [Coraliomargarita parva]|uniref:GntR family transcriptional regulator n=1 Tax=Coraliomargarita parva TaxID=3014050 RepID=UPI0022B419E4|nr:GntR family transcriptional regulator [Coraliomargarita parva]